jgi:hypothetical protein
MNNLNIKQLVDLIVGSHQDESKINYVFDGTNYHIEFNNQNFKFDKHEFDQLNKFLPAIKWES